MLKLGCRLQLKAISLISLTTKAVKYKETAKMGRKRHRPLINEQENSPEELDEVEANNLSDRQFRIMIIKILNSMKKTWKPLKKDQLEIKDTMSEINNTLEGINSRLDEAEDQISDVEDKVEKNTQTEQQKEKKILKK